MVIYKKKSRLIATFSFESNKSIKSIGSQCFIYGDPFDLIDLFEPKLNVAETNPTLWPNDKIILKLEIKIFGERSVDCLVFYLRVWVYLFLYKGRLITIAHRKLIKKN